MKLYEQKLVLEINNSFLHLTEQDGKLQGIYADYTPTEPGIEIFGVLGALQLPSGYKLTCITQQTLVGSLSQAEIFAINECKVFPVSKANLDKESMETEEQMLELFQRALNGHMYYSHGWDLTNRQQNQLKKKINESFVWNKHLLTPFFGFPTNNVFLVPAISGFVNLKTLSSGTYALISRKKNTRPGVRFHSRGIDLDGNVSNFVETEQIFILGDEIYSHVQIRGSIPVFWRQIVNGKYTPPVEMMNSNDSKRVFQIHMDEITKEYGESTLVNLVDKKGFEMMLSREFELLCIERNEKLKYIHFDFHKECRKMQYNRISILYDKLELSFFKTKNNKVELNQNGIVRTNCIDCLDRTNVVQSYIAKKILNKWINLKMEDEVVFQNLWADNADALSLLYSGTGALKTDFTRTGSRTKKGVFNDFLNSITRYVLNNYFDGRKQDGLYLMLGLYRPPQPKDFNGLAKSKFNCSFLSRQMTQYHYMVISVFCLCLAISYWSWRTQSFFTFLRVYLLCLFMGFFAVSIMIHYFGKKIVDVPCLVPDSDKKKPY